MLGRFAANRGISRRERLRLEHAVRLAEYRALRVEIDRLQASSYQIATLSLTAIGGLIAAAPFLLQSHAESLFLVAPFLFYALSWMDLRYVYQIRDIGNYFRDRLIPSIRKALPGRSGETNATDELLEWEFMAATTLHARRGRVSRWLYLPIAATNITGVAGIASISVYVALTLQGGRSFTRLDEALLTANLVVGLYTIYWAGRSMFRP